MTTYSQLTGPKEGKYLKVKFNGQFVNGVTGYNPQPKADKKEVTCALNALSGAVAWKRWMSTLKDATITLTLAFLDLSDVGQKALWDNLGGVAAELRLYEDDTHYMFVDAFVDSFPIGAKIDDIEGTATSVTLQINDPDGIQFPSAFD